MQIQYFDEEIKEGAFGNMRVSCTANLITVRSLWETMLGDARRVERWLRKVWNLRKVWSI